MRKNGLVLAIVLLALTASFAGCFGKNKEAADDEDADNGGTPTPSTPPPSTTPPTSGSGSGTGSGSGNGTRPGTGGTTPPPPPKPADVNATTALSVGSGINVIPGSPFPATGTSGAVTVKDAGWKTFEVLVTTKSIQADSVKITILDPAGAPVGETTISNADPTGQTLPAPVTITVTGTTVGDYTATGSAGAAAASAEFELTFMVKY